MFVLKRPQLHNESCLLRGTPHICLKRAAHSFQHKYASTRPFPFPSPWACGWALSDQHPCGQLGIPHGVTGQLDY